MQENGEIIGYIFESVQRGPLTKRLEYNYMIKIVRYYDGDIKEKMAVYTGTEKRAILDLEKRLIKNREELEPKIRLEELAAEINMQTRSL